VYDALGRLERRVRELQEETEKRAARGTADDVIWIQSATLPIQQAGEHLQRMAERTI